MINGIGLFAYWSVLQRLKHLSSVSNITLYVSYGISATQCVGFMAKMQSASVPYQ